MDEKKAQDRPAMFVDTGVALLLTQVLGMGGHRSRLQVRVAGGGNMMDPERHFNIGERNYTVLRKILWKNNILIAGEDVGGNTPRTMHLLMNDGKTLIRSGASVREL
jgi:chemotaxis protein CheD